MFALAYCPLCVFAGGNQISDAGCTRLAENLQGSSLTTLYLSKCLKSSHSACGDPPGDVLYLIKYFLHPKIKATSYFRRGCNGAILAVYNFKSYQMFILRLLKSVLLEFIRHMARQAVISAVWQVKVIV